MAFIELDVFKSWFFLLDLVGVGGALGLVVARPILILLVKLLVGWSSGYQFPLLSWSLGDGVLSSILEVDV